MYLVVMPTRHASWQYQMSTPVVQVDAYERGHHPAPYALHGHDSEVTCVAWCPTDPCKVATCGDDCSVRLWHVEAPASVSPLPAKRQRTSQRRVLQPLETTAVEMATPAPRGAAPRASTPLSGQQLQTPASQVVGSAARRQTASQATIQRSLLDFVTATKTTQGASEACSTNNENLATKGGGLGGPGG